MRLEDQEEPVYGFKRGATVKAVKAHRAIAPTGNPISICENSVGLVDEDDRVCPVDRTQFVHFEVGRATHCVSFPIDSMTSI
jgi:hypothetical protein